MLSDMSAYRVNDLRRMAVELSEKRLEEEDRKAFSDAKAVEVGFFIAAEAFETIPPHMRPPKETAVGMRWLLTWRVKEDGTVTPQARAILPGYQARVRTSSHHGPGNDAVVQTAFPSAIRKPFLESLAARYHWSEGQSGQA